MCCSALIIIHSNPPNTSALGTGEKTAVLANGGKRSHYITNKKYIRDLGKAVNGGAVLRTTTVSCFHAFWFYYY